MRSSLPFFMSKFMNLWKTFYSLNDLGIFVIANFLRQDNLVLVTPLHWRAFQNATISNMQSDNCKALQNYAESDSFITDSALGTCPALKTS
jgi:hypothetical protein